MLRGGIRGFGIFPPKFCINCSCDMSKCISTEQARAKWKLKDRITPQVNFFQKFSVGWGWKDRQRRWRMIDELIDVNCMWRVACSEVVCVCVKDGVWHRCVWKVVCDNVACDKGVCVCACACMKKSVWQRCVRKLVCRRCVLKMTQSAAASRGVTGETSASLEPAQSHKYHTCHAKRRWMSPSATPATWNDGGCHQVPRLPRKVPRCHAAPREIQARLQSQPNRISNTPATQNDGGCRQVPCLPRETTADVTKCRLPRKVPRHHAASREIQARHQSQPNPISATPATWNDGGCHQAPRLPHKTKADVTKCHACHAKCRGLTRRHGRSKRVTRASPVP